MELLVSVEDSTFFELEEVFELFAEKISNSENKLAMIPKIGFLTENLCLIALKSDKTPRITVAIT